MPSAVAPPAAPLAAPREAPRAIRLACCLAIAGLAVWLGREGGVHIQKRDPDFEYFYRGGAALLAQGTFDPGYDLIAGKPILRGSLDWYWPCVPRMMTVLAVLPFEVAGFVWLGANIAALIATVRLVGRHMSGLPPQDWPVTQLVPVLLLVGFWWWEFRLNQVNNLTLLLLVGSYVCWQAGRPLTSGFWLGLAVLLKLTPGLLVVWFILKRQFRVTAAALMTILLAGPAADVLALGPELAADGYRAWFTRAVSEGSHRALILEHRELDWRNQGLGAVASRWLTHTSYATKFDNDPRIRRDLGTVPPRYLNVLELPRELVALGVSAATGAILLSVIWLARRPAGTLTAWQLRFEWALFVLVMLLLMPVMRRYHVIWAYPAVALIATGAHFRAFRGWWVVCALGSLCVLLATQLLLLLTPEAGTVTPVTAIEAAGAFYGPLALLALVIAALLRLLARDARALPASPFDVTPRPGEPQTAPPTPAVGAGHA